MESYKLLETELKLYRNGNPGQIIFVPKNLIVGVGPETSPEDLSPLLSFFKREGEL